MKFKDIEEMTKELRKDYDWWDKFILQDSMNWLRWLIYNLPDVPRDIYNNIKWFIQRGRRGYADCDVWLFDYYLSTLIVAGVKQLRQNLHSHPTYCKSLEEWEYILKELQWTFETAKKIIDGEYCYFVKKERTQSNINFNKKFNIYTMTKEECQRYRTGWRLLQKYYFGLWD